MTDESASSVQRPVRSIFVRILFGFLWFLAFYFLTNMLIGGVVGGIAGASTNSFEAGASAGRRASIDFYHKYGLIVFLVQNLVFAGLCVFGVLPGIGKHKKLM
jgi:hypothetical protein